MTALTALGVYKDCTLHKASRIPEYLHDLSWGGALVSHVDDRSGIHMGPSGPKCPESELSGIEGAFVLQLPLLLFLRKLTPSCSLGQADV